MAIYGSEQNYFLEESVPVKISLTEKKSFYWHGLAEYKSDFISLTLSFLLSCIICSWGLNVPWSTEGINKLCLVAYVLINFFKYQRIHIMCALWSYFTHWLHSYISPGLDIYFFHALIIY